MYELIPELGLWLQQRRHWVVLQPQVQEQEQVREQVQMRGLLLELG
jgi:hypothetical protein